MTMNNILQKEAKKIGAEILNVKEYSNKIKFSILYDDMIEHNCEILKTCTPSHEKELCIQVIYTGIASMYLKKGDLKNCKKYMKG